MRYYCSYYHDDWDELLPADEFGYNSVVTEHLGMSPFELDIRCNLKSARDFVTYYKRTVDDLKNKLRKSLNSAQYSYVIGKEKQSTDLSQKYKTPNCALGSNVCINKSYQFDHLSSRRVGPFLVKELIGKSTVRLDLPDHFKSHPVVHVSQKMPFLEQTNGIRQPVQPKPQPI